MANRASAGAKAGARSLTKQRLSLEERPGADAAGDDEREDQQQHVVQVQHVLRVVPAQHIRQVWRDDEQKPPGREQRQAAHAGDDHRDHGQGAWPEQRTEDIARVQWRCSDRAR